MGVDVDKLKDYLTFSTEQRSGFCINKRTNKAIKAPKLYDILSKVNVDFVLNNSNIKKTLEARFPWILIDEYQDLGLIIKTRGTKIY